MITSNIGKIFLNAYNEKYGKEYTAKEFFDEVFYSLAFDANKYLQWVQNSPFVQMKAKQKVENLTPEERREKLVEFHQKIESGNKDASVALGYAASEEKEFATTSGQITNIDIKTTHEDIYLSWIGACLGLGVKGGITILFDDPNLLLDIFEGWQHYRNVLNANQLMKGNQLVSAWNAQWLTHRYSKYYNANKVLSNFDPFVTKNDGMSVDTISWTHLLIGICRHFSNVQMMGYVYSLGQTNTTIGFIPFALNQIRRPYDLYQKLFQMEDEAEDLWGTAFGFTRACQQGCVGVRAMEPKGLQDYVVDGRMPKYKDDQQQEILFKTYITWIIAMLNNEELWDKSQEIAQLLINYLAEQEKGRTDRGAAVKKILESTRKEKFLENLISIMEDKNNMKCYEIGKDVHYMLATDFPYFATLVRFQYASLTKKI